VPGAPDLAVVNARVRTLHPGQPLATAVAMRDGWIVAVGSDAEVRRRCGRSTEVIDLEGAAVVPGLVDSHSHPFMGALETRGADLAGAETIEDVRDRLAAERRRCGDGGWITGHSLAYSVFEQHPPSGQLFSDAVGGAPAMLTFFDFHTALVTPAALTAAGIDGPRTFSDTSEIVCDAGGQPTGELRETSAMSLVTDVMPELTHEQQLAAIAEALAAMNRTGLTACHMMDGTLATPSVCRELEESGRLTVRQVVPFTVEPTMSDEAIDEAIRAGADGGPLWRSGWAKFFIDGVVETGTAWLDEPDSNDRGRLPNWPRPERYAEVIRRFADAGFPSITHAIGDRAVRCALDAYRAAGRVARGPHRVEHIETMKDSELPRFAGEGVAASQQAIHLQWMKPDMTDPWSSTLGPERCRRGFRLSDIRRSGAILALGSDWPVAGYGPREGMAWARLRRAPGRRDRDSYFPRQCLTAVEALEGYTVEAAKAVAEEDIAGRIAPGMRADLTVFAEDPIECPADDLPQLPVTMTVVSGRVVHRLA
jgi:predicted amidohydrolase YtcJ